MSARAETVIATHLLRSQPGPLAPSNAVDAGGSLAGSCPHTSARHQFVIESQRLEYSRAAAGLVARTLSLVGQAGCIFASHAEHARACRCREATCLARASGVRAASRPSLAALTSRSAAPPMAHSAQLVRPIWMVFPHLRQRFSLRGSEIGDGGGDPPFASRL